MYVSCQLISSVPPTNYFIGAWCSYVCGTFKTLHLIWAFSLISRLEGEKKIGSFIIYQPQPDSAMDSSVNFSLIISAC